MKKEAGLILFAILLISSVNALQYACPNPSDLQTNSKEIDEGKVATILTIPLGICEATENSFSGWLAADVFIDSNLITIQGTNSTAGTELISGNTSVSYTNPSSDSIKIKIGRIIIFPI